MPRVSVIVAAHNAQATLTRAVESVVAQTMDDWELLVVDDCSTDGTVAILESLATRLGGRLKVLSTSTNQGPAMARNIGLEAASGEWIGFLDSDDEYLPDRLKMMLAATDERTDVVACAHLIVSTDGSERLRTPRRTGDLSGTEAAAATLAEEQTNYVWDKLFRARAITDLRFPPIRRAEDNVFTVSALSRARTVRYLSEPGIRYHVSPTSLTWGRVATRQETATLVDLLRQAVAEHTDAVTERALATSKTAAWLSVAHQGITAKPAAERIDHVRGCTRELSWGEIVDALRTHPLLGVAAGVMKLLPGPYATLYAAYASRVYGVEA